MKQYLTEAEMAKSLGVSTLALWRYRKEGLPFIRIGGRGLRFDPDDVDDWLKAHWGSIPSRAPPPYKRKEVLKESPAPEMK